MNVNDFKIIDIDGNETTLGSFGTHLLIVNVASRCGLTSQYADLQQLHEIYDDLTVVGFPCNQFMHQEPGDESDIKKFVTERYNVTFPMMSKIDVKGDDIHPLYKHLTGSGKRITWNFEKFLVSKDNEVIIRHSPQIEPLQLMGDIDILIAKN